MRLIDTMAAKWQQSSNWFLPLLPLSWLFAVIVTVRRFLYNKGWLKSYNPTVPMVVVGNIVVGGSGKSPLVAWLANKFTQHNLQVVVLSHGYRGVLSFMPQEVAANSNAIDVGDEAVMLASQVEAPVVVCSNRVKGVEFILEHYNPDVIVSDDGLQHYALKRTVEIVVSPSNFNKNKFKLLPAGPGREPVSRLKQADFIVNSGLEGSNSEIALGMKYSPVCFRKVKNPDKTKSLKFFAGKEVTAIAAIANPERFFTMLQELKVKATTKAFRDHYYFNKSDLKADNPIIMTHKDAVKCARFAPDNAWFLEIKADISDELFNGVLSKIKQETKND